MAWALDDRWLWLGFGALFYVAAKGIAYGLRDTLQLTEFDRPTDNAKPDHESHAEDSIGLDSLRTLATSPNPDIANAAISLLVSRFASSDAACNELTLDLFSGSKEIRHHAKYVLDLLDNYPLPADFPKPDVLRTQCVRDLQASHKADHRMYMLCVRYFKALNRHRHGLLSHRDVADAVEAGMRIPSSTLQDSEHVPAMRGDNGPYLELDLSVETLDQIISRAGANARPVRVPSAALSALLHTQADRESHLLHGRGTRFLEESPEEAEVRRRRNRAARVMEIAEDYVIV
ncbi:hypothetical protein BDV97DRAFT_419676 [Delphinella strobiligena]|nr:hypothetical protein BDV97DRAFT_419676 [Delphinella strobiligena]